MATASEPPRLWQPPLVELFLRDHTDGAEASWPCERNGLACLSKTLEWAHQVFSDAENFRNQLGSSLGALKEPWGRASCMVQEAEARTKELLAIAELDSPEAEQKLHAYLAALVKKLGTLPIGKAVLLPVAWPDTSADLSKKASPGFVLPIPGLFKGADVEGRPLHAAIIVVQRRSKTSGSFALVNPRGSGSEYHPRQLNGSPTRPTTCGLPVRIEDVPWTRMCCTVFWLLVFRQSLQKEPKPVPQTPLPLGSSRSTVAIGGGSTAVGGGDKQGVGDEDAPTALEIKDDGDPHPELLYEGLLPFLTQERRIAQLAKQLASPAVANGVDLDWSPVPTRDETKVSAVLSAIVLALRGPPGADSGLAQWVVLCLKWEALRRSLGKASTPARTREACRALARAAAELGCSMVIAAPSPWRPSLLSSIHTWILEQLSGADLMDSKRQMLPEAPSSWRTPDALTACSHGGFSRLAEFVDTVNLAGNPDRPEVILPTPIVQLPALVKDYHEAAVAVRQSVRLCSLIANQHSVMPNADYHIVGLVQHLFTNVFPIPLPSEGFWWNQPMQHETQTVLSHELGQLARHFVAASLNLPQTVHLHAIRLILLAALMAVLDVTIRRIPEGIESELSRIYTGLLRDDLRCSGFGLAALPLDVETSELTIADPQIAQIRTASLDYLEGVVGEGKDTCRRVFAFSQMRFGEGDDELLHRLALLRGFVRGDVKSRDNKVGLRNYFVGQPSDFLSAFPGLSTLRDTSFLLRWLCTPMSAVMADRRRSDGLPWRAGDAELKWEYCIEDFKLKVTGFQRSMSLEETEQSSTAVKQTPRPSAWTSFTEGGIWSLFSSRAVQKRSLSPASLGLLAGEGVSTEDDVLHLPRVPTFGDRLSAADSELMLLYLTAPYLRVPLLLQFFNDRSRFGALACSQLQAMLDAALFEPGPFLQPRSICERMLSKGNTPMDEVPLPPSLYESMAATPAGRLVNELVHSPDAILPELDGIFRLAMERDTPTYSKDALPVLYAIRLWVRLAAFARLVARCSKSARSGDSEPPRGFCCAAPKVAEVLEARSRAWFIRLRFEAVPTLERWCSRAMESGETDVACICWLHLALIYRWSHEVSMHSVSTLLCAEVYVNANLKIGIGLDARLELFGMPEAEIFSLFHAVRGEVYRWLRRHNDAQGRDRVLEHVVMVVAAGTRNTDDANVLGRRWLELAEMWDGLGRFAPSVPIAADAALAETDFAKWLTGSVDAAPVEINLNIGQLQFRQHVVTPVPRNVTELPEFKEIFPDLGVDNSGLMWAMVERTATRKRYRFAGLRIEFREWERGLSQPNLVFSRGFPGQATLQEQWLVHVLDAEQGIREIWSGHGKSDWYAPAEEMTSDVARLMTRHLAQGKLKEIEVFRNPAVVGGSPVVHVYHTVECGPRFVRVQTFTSDPAWSYAASPQPLQAPATSFLKGVPPLLEIVHEDTSGESAFVPHRLMAGVLPDSLLDSFEFWRPRNDRLVGKMKPEARRRAPIPYALVVHLNDGHGVLVERVTLDASNRTDEAKQIDLLLHSESPGSSSQRLIGSNAPGEVLMDLLRARQGTCVWHAARWALQLDDLSHVLVWMRGEVIDGKLHGEDRPQIDFIEFPRLGLSFSRPADDSRLRCDQHGGLAVTLGPITDANIIRLLRPFPKFVLLEDDTQEKFALVSVADKPSRAPDGGVILVRNDQDWLEKLKTKTAKHYLFAVHPSFEFMVATTPVADLHLMLMRVLHRMYSEACAGVTTILTSDHANDQVDEELLWQMVTDTLFADPGVDAAVLRLKLMLVMHRLGRELPTNWSPEDDLEEWSSSGTNSFAGRLLTLAEEAALVELCRESASDQLKARGDVYSKLLRIKSPEDDVPRDVGSHCTAFEISRCLQNVTTASRGDRTLDDARDLNVLHSLDETYQTLSHGTITSEDALRPLHLEQVLVSSNWGGPQKTGVRFIVNLLRHGRPRLPEDFFALFEMACTTRNGWVLPSDDTALSTEMLLRLISPQEMLQNAGQAGLLRAMFASPTIAKTMPTFSGNLEMFATNLTASLKLHHREILSQVPKAPEEAVVPHTPTWKFILDGQGRWSPVDELPAQTTGAAGRRLQSLDDFLQGGSEEAGFDAKDQHSMTNKHLIALTYLLKTVQDRRLPSPVWDFDSNPRKLAAKAGSADDDMPQGADGADDFHSPRSVTSDGHDCGDDAIGFDDLPPTLQRRLPKLFMSDFQQLLSRPMMTGNFADVVTETTAQASTSVAELPVLQILAPIISQTVAGESILRRMREQRGESGEKSSAHCFLGMTRTSVSEILADPQQIRENLLEVSKRLAELHKMLDNDRKTVAKVARLAVELANDVAENADASEELRLRRCGHKLGQLGGTEALLSFQDITQLLAVKGGAEAVLPHFAQHLDQRSVRNVTSACALAMLLSTRTIICKRCINQLTRLQDLLHKAADVRSTSDGKEAPHRGWLSLSLSFITGGAGSEVAFKSGLMTEIADAASQAATEFATVQHCVDINSTVATYDPVLLVFQFVSHIMLRKKQVGLVQAMVAAVEQKRPLVHQMLMGQGKTTVITPLVALLAARATRMCVVCTPAALLEFTCSVLRKRLCAALTRPVVIFSFSRSDVLSDDLRLRLLHYQESRTVLCAGPTALKSMLLRFLLAIHEIDVARSQEQERKEKQKHQSRGEALMNTLWRRQSSGELFEERLRKSKHEAEILGESAKVFLTGVLLLDECDLLMHPLRSELHWPLGDQHTLDFTAGQGENNNSCLVATQAGNATVAGPSRSHAGQARNVLASHLANQDAGARWQIALHLLDIVFSCQLPDGPAVKTFMSKPEAAAIIKKFREVVAMGLQEKCLQAAPHLTLLSVGFYHEELRPILAEWVLVWMRRRHPLGVPDEDVVLYLCGETPKNQQLFQDLGEQPMKALNLSRGWLSVLLPHVMSRIHRVHYGLLSEAADSWSKESRARRHFAVPFVGKDAPSDTSQFSHPDVVIGLTWVSHRLAGLRPDDFKRALTALMRLQNTEADLAPRFRHARHLYNAWVSAAGAHVRGDMDGNLNVVPTIDQDSLVLQDPSVLRSKGGVGTLVVPPLEWLDINDTTQVKAVSEVLHRSPFLVEFYLHEVVFPQLLRHTDAKLSASGHDLGGENLCGSRLGFSGTPNDLLPRSLGSCVYEPGDDSQMLHTLTDPSVIQVWRAEEGWSAHSLLKVIATQQPPLSALIDVGALITGLSNLEVAQMLLDSGLPYEAVVFCDHGGEQQLLLRGRLEPVSLAHCTLPPERRFVFYDQVHTTGIDIKHSPNACAAVTVGKDSTFRDFAQGAYRMRGVGHGQTLRVLLTPEVVARVSAEVPGTAEGEGVSPVQSPRRKGAGSGGISTEEASKSPEAMLDRVCAWLLVKQAGNENKQQSLLRRHAIAHEGRRCAYSLLREKASSHSFSTPSAAPPPEDGQALDLFRERVDYTVETGLPGSRRNVINPINSIVERMVPFLDAEGTEAVRKNLLEVVADSGQESPLTRDVGVLLREKDNVLVEALRDQEWELNAEQEQEHEQELFQEQEQEEEQEEEQEQEEEREEMAAAAAKAETWQALPRDDPQDKWRLEVLGEPPTEISGPFYPVSKFELPNAGARSEVSVSFPSSLWVSRHFHRSGKGRVQRRLRTPSVLLEWVPDEAALSEESGGSTGSRDSGLPGRVRVAMPLLGLENREVLNMEDARRLLSALNIDASDEEVAHVVACVRRAQAEMEDEASGRTPGSPSTPRTPSASPKRPKKQGRNSAGGLSAAVEDGLRRANALQAQPGRYYVLLTLAEAEAVRLALHQRGPDGQLLADKPGTSIALRLLRRETGGFSKLDSSRGWRPSPFQWQEHAVAHCVMYLGAESQFSAPELEMLRWTMRHNLWKGGQATPPAKLREFWLASYSLRRRPQPPQLVDVPILYIFKTDGEISKQRHDAIFTETYARLSDAGLSPEKAFQLLDRNQDGEVWPADFAACHTFGLRLPPRLLPQLFEALDQDRRGFFRRAEWGVAFDARHEMREAAAAEAQVQNGDPIRPPENVPIAALRRIKIEVVTHANYSLVWSSEGMLSRRATSIWEPDVNYQGFMRSSGLRLSVGHYANQGFSDCRTGNRNGIKTRAVLQLRDKNIFVRGSTSSQEYLQSVADHYCPFPKKFRLVWSQARGKQLFVWLPVPPSDAFVALGMVATTSSEPPQVSIVRCVAKSWCQPALKAPVFLWDDSGSGGKPASIWIVNGLQVLWLTPGHNSPQGTCWELANDTISFDYAGQPSVHITHITETLTDPQRQRTSTSVSRRSPNIASSRRSTGGVGKEGEVARADRRKSMPAR